MQSLEEIAEELLKRLQNNRNPQQLVTAALHAAFDRGVAAGLDAERVIIKDALNAYFQQRDAARQAGELVYDATPPRDLIN